MSTLDDRHLRNSHNLVSSKISHTRKNIRKIENENLQLLKRISAVSPTVRNSKLRKEREKGVKVLKLRGKYPYVEQMHQRYQADTVPSLNHSGSQSINGPFYKVSSRTHLSNFPAPSSGSPENHRTINVHASADMRRPGAHHYVERYENYIRDQQLYASLPP